MKPYRSDRHLAFVRTLKCSVPRCQRKGEAAHIGPHGMGQKAPDGKAAPLCRPHHAELGDAGRLKFERKYDISLLEIADRIAMKPFLYLADGLFVGRIEGEHYLLTPARMGVKSAVRQMVGLRKEALREAA